MAMCKLTILCTVVSMVVLCAEGLPRFHNLQKRNEGTRLCGRMLGDVMALVCNNIYYDPSNQQRVARKRNYGKYAGPNSWSGEMDSEEFTDPQAALEFLGARKLRNTGGVADECCKKPCTYAVLLSYCGSENLVLE